MTKRQIQVTGALPYANGMIHVGHLVEYLQADFWARFQRLQGNDCYYVCADDTHGTPIMVEARKRGIKPEALLDEAWKAHTDDFRAFQIQFSHYSSTNSEENRKLCEEFFAKMREGGHIQIKSIDQLYCDHDKMFLPDRFVKGTCPKCGSKDQYGDSCDVCGATYQPADMKDVYCSICGSTPVLKASEHLLFRLENFRDYLLQWLPEHTSAAVANKMKEWFNEPLRDWDISRDAPYFGFEIPGFPGKYFYVWVDAPMGYVSGFQQLCQKIGLDFDSYWRTPKNTEVYHFIGKDITYFHTLFWPALLKAAGFRTPDKVFVHGHLTVNGEKMSKSKGTQLNARTYLNHLDPAYLRYYYACKLNSSNDDLDLSMDDFTQRVNSDLVGKITNLGSRGAQMLGKRFGGELTAFDPAGAELVKKTQAKSDEIAAHFEGREFAKGINEIRALADEANRYFDEKAPWKLVETDPAATQKVLSATLNVFKNLSIYLKPILPVYAERVEKLFNQKPWSWSDVKHDLTSGRINDYEHLMTRIDPVKIKAMLEESAAGHAAKAAADEALKKKNAAPGAKMENTSAAKPADGAPKAPAARDMSLLPEIEIDTFSKIDLRVAQIVDCEAIPEADKLLRMKVSLGPLGERQIIAGIKSAYSAEQLKGRMVVVVANLKPRKMKFGMSEGMALAAGAGGKELFLLSPDSGAKPGDPVK